MITIVDMSSKILLEQIGELRRLASLLATQKFRRLGLGPKQVVLMRALARNKDAVPSTLARATGSDPGAVARMIDSLVRTGWVARRRLRSDRRSLRISLTPLGADQMDAVEQIYTELADHIVSGLSCSEQAALSELLQKLNASLSLRGQQNEE